MIKMIKVGFIDDETANYADYAKRLKRQNVDLLLYEGDNTSSEDIVNWLIDENLECLLIDYDLRKKFARNGTDLVFEINQYLPEFPCIMLTNYPEQSKDEKLVPRRLIWDREEMNKPNLTEVVDSISNEVAVYLKRKEILFEQYGALIEKRKNSVLTASEEEKLLQLHTLFSRYGETDDFPAQLLSSDINKKLDSLIERMSQLLAEKGQ